jgi:Flp pilus assembly protein TadG
MLTPKGIMMRLSERLRHWRKPREEQTFLARLRGDVRGNTLAIMAAMLFPLAGLVGGGIDMSRLYITKTRLQHACDAGALAGRKAMGGGTWNQSNNMPNTSAVQFFDANYRQGLYGSSGLTRSFRENAGKVTGSASVRLPMTLMKIFAFGPKTISVSCSTEMRLPNTDIMFVLDTTGSMGDTPSGDSQTKIASLKVAVKCFYEIVARLDTDATCTTGTPGGGTGSEVQIRFGFVPYATNVNVGRLLNPAWMADQWPYQSRASRWWIRQGNPQSTSQSVSQSGVQQYDCTQANADAQSNLNSNTTTYSSGYNANQDSAANNGATKTTTVVKTTVTSWKSYTCYGMQTTTKTTFNLQENVVGGANDQFIDYHYGRITQPVSGLKNGSGWNNSIALPIGTNGALQTVDWDGCIEERQTVRATTYDPIPSGALDLNIDLTPVAGDASTQWGPALPDMIYTRNGYTNSWTLADAYTTSDYGNRSSYSCAAPARKLQAWPDASLFSSYVNTLTPSGNTYHDIGLLWGARLMSPTGLFANENAYTPQGGEIQRNMIFMTDGDPCTASTNYQAYGLAWFDRRETDPNTAPSLNQNCTSGAPLTDQVNARTDALCSAIKNKNITLWVVTFGQVANQTVNRLKACASPDRYFSATNAAQLQATFASIANQISQLRLTQ